MEKKEDCYRYIARNGRIIDTDTGKEVGPVYMTAELTTWLLPDGNYALVRRTDSFAVIGGERVEVSIDKDTLKTVRWLSRQKTLRSQDTPPDPPIAGTSIRG